MTLSATILQPRAFGSLNRVDPLDSVSNYYVDIKIMCIAKWLLCRMVIIKKPVIFNCGTPRELVEASSGGLHINLCGIIHPPCPVLIFHLGECLAARQCVNLCT